MAVVAFVIVAPAIASGCRAPVAAPTEASVNAAVARSPGQWMVRTELIFGFGLKDSEPLREPDWQKFVDEVITPRFTDGFTIMPGRGQWRGRDSVIRAEPSRVLVLVHGGDDRTNEKIEQIRTVYRQLFSQESVLRIDTPVRAAF